MAEHICIDEDDDYANDLRRYAARNENEKKSNNDRSLRRLRPKSVKMECGCNHKRKRQQVDDTYAHYLNFYASEFGSGGFDDTDCVNADDDLQYSKFLSFLKPYRTSYVLDLVEVDGALKSFAYEDDGITSDLPKHDANQNAICGQERNGGMLRHFVKILPDSGNGKDSKFANEPSKTHGRSPMKDKIGRENAGQKKSLFGSPDSRSLKSVTTDSQKQSIDVSYQFYLVQCLEGKQAEKLSCVHDSQKRNIQSVAAKAILSTLRTRQGKKRRLSQDSGEGMNTTMDANVSKGVNGDRYLGMSGHVRPKLESKQGGKPRHCRNLRSSSQKTITDKAIQKHAGMQPPNDKQLKKHRRAVDHENNDRRSVAPKVEQEAIAAVPLRKIPGDKLVKNHRFSGSSEQTTKRTLTDSVAKDPSGLHALNACQSSGKKSCPKIHSQPGSVLGFDGQINDSYGFFLNNLTLYDSKPVFRSKEGRVATYEQDMKFTDSDSDSDAVMIIGDSENGKRQISKQTSYKKKLMSILLKPYDKKEYKSLMERANERKPLEGYRDMRGGRNGTYELESLGKSYLDHYKDVAKAIKDCGGNHWKILTILRGFMFWIEHVAHHGAFRPWVYEEYLKVKPQKSSLQKV